MREWSKNLWSAVSGLIMAALITGCSQPQSDMIRFNQIGFYPSEEKTAVLVGRNSAREFIIRNADTGDEVYTGELSGPRKSTFSDKETYVMTFTDLATPGKYFIEIEGIGHSEPFAINENLLSPLVSSALKGFYYQRTAMPIEEQYAGKWNRPSAHPDDQVMIHPSAAIKERPAGTIISSPKGWYDAGDYNKYIVNSGFTVGVLLSLYEDYPEYVKQLVVNIPESNNSTPDLLDEVYWNLEWMLTMQDSVDGGVYHKLTTPSFEGFIKPADCSKQRYVVAKSVTAALDFAASMAQGSRIYAEYEADYPGASVKMLSAARRAFDWALANPGKLYQQNEMNKSHEPAISTGEYGDQNANDEFFWAATELYIATGNPNYLDALKAFMPDKYVLPVWGNVSGLGNLAIMRHSDRIDEDIVYTMIMQLMDYTDEVLKDYESSPYAAPYGRVARDFFWGCNSDAASNQGMTFLWAWILTEDKKYLNAALSNMDYILGRNATGYCYLTGFGHKSPMFPHHRLSASDEIEEPIPGFLVGGPNAGKQDGCKYPSDIADECYVDDEASYASNEIAINWQGLFTYFSAALDANLSKK